jgi:excisionase family DNA binding protein
MSDEPILLKPKEAGSLIGFGERKIYQLIHEGKLPAYWLDGEHKRLLRIKRRDLEAYVASLPPIEDDYGMIDRRRGRLRDFRDDLDRKRQQS